MFTQYFSFALLDGLGLGIRGDPRCWCCSANIPYPSYGAELLLGLPGYLLIVSWMGLLRFLDKLILNPSDQALSS